MKKILILFIPLFCLLACGEQGKKDLYTIGIFQVNNALTLNDTRAGFMKAMEDVGLINGENIKFILRDGKGDISEVQKIAGEFVDQKVDMILALSTPCFQAALRATRDIPIVFSSVANPYLAGAGMTAEDHLNNVSGVSSKGPIKESLVFIKRIIPEAKRIGTLWTPSELNSNYYLELAREGAEELGFEIVSVPIANSSEVLFSTQVLINKKIDAICQISDNTINSAFEALGNVAGENSIPLFGGYPSFTQYGACAAMGWDFYDMGYKTGKIAIRVKNGENVADIPIQYMKDVRIHLNLNAAKRQNIIFSDEILKEADEIIPLENQF